MAISPCPNDTFIFGAWINAKIPDDVEPLPSVSYLDIEALNRAALDGMYDVIKISAAIAHRVTDVYVLLNCGGALSMDIGPVLVSKEPHTPDAVPADARIMLPGLHTTAHYLFSRFFPHLNNKTFRIFSSIEQAILNGEADLGVLIHETRFSYQAKGLHLVADLGAMWTQALGLPVPLGVIAAKRTLGRARLHTVELAIRCSLEFQKQYPKKLWNYIMDHAAGMDSELAAKHIDAYVNRFSYELGDDGRTAILEMLGGGGTQKRQIDKFFLI